MSSVRAVARFGGTDPLYARMARALRHSLHEHGECVPDVRRSYHEPTAKHGDAFERKARDWCSAIATARDGEQLALLDVDTLVQRPLAAAFAEPFDVAVTTRGGSGTLNSGVVFVRASDRVRRFFAPWEQRTRPWSRRNLPGRPTRYGDQDALRVMLAEPHDLVVVELPAERWNCEQHCWSAAADAAIVHVKSDAREMIVGPAPERNHGAADVCRLWLAAECRAAACAECCAAVEI